MLLSSSGFRVYKVVSDSIVGNKAYGVVFEDKQTQVMTTILLIAVLLLVVTALVKLISAIYLDVSRVLADKKRKQEKLAEKKREESVKPEDRPVGNRLALVDQRVVTKYRDLAEEEFKKELNAQVGISNYTYDVDYGITNDYAINFTFLVKFEDKPFYSVFVAYVTGVTDSETEVAVTFNRLVKF